VPGVLGGEIFTVVGMDSNSFRWQRGLLAVSAIACMLLVVNTVEDNTWRGRIALGHDVTQNSFHDIVTTVRPGSPAANSGVKEGDLVDLRAASSTDRWRFRNDRWLADRSYTYVFVRGAYARKITLPSKPLRSSPSAWGWNVGALGALIFAAIIAWRRASLVEARVLSLLLIVPVIWTSLLGKNWITPWGALDFGADLISSAALSSQSALLVGYTLLFGRPISTFRKLITGLAFVLIGLSLLYAWATDVGTWSGAFDLEFGATGVGAVLAFWVQLLNYALPLLAIVTAVAAARGRARSLLIWTTATLFLTYLIEVVWVSVPDFLATQALFGVLQIIINGSQFLTPFAIGYALLSRRLLDVGFVINQAAVFSGVSIVVVGLFMFGEWVIGSWFGKVTHATNLAMSAALAVGLGFSVRAIHARVERVLDVLFFRKRHDDETAIRTLAEEASDSTDVGTLVRKTKETLENHADAAFVTFAMDDGTGRYGNASEDDPAIAALRDRRKPVDLKTLPTQLKGEFAYPMVARGKLVGALVLGPKRSGESYAPDESRAIMQLAHELGSALRILTLETALQEQRSPA